MTPTARRRSLQKVAQRSHDQDAVFSAHHRRRQQRAAGAARVVQDAVRLTAERERELAYEVHRRRSYER